MIEHEQCCKSGIHETAVAPCIVSLQLWGICSNMLFARRDALGLLHTRLMLVQPRKVQQAVQSMSKCFALQLWQQGRIL